MFGAGVLDYLHFMVYVTFLHDISVTDILLFTPAVIALQITDLLAKYVIVL